MTTAKQRYDYFDQYASAFQVSLGTEFVQGAERYLSDMNFQLVFVAREHPEEVKSDRFLSYNARVVQAREDYKALLLRTKKENTRWEEAVRAVSAELLLRAMKENAGMVKAECTIAAEKQGESDDA